MVNVMIYRVPNDDLLSCDWQDRRPSLCVSPLRLKGCHYLSIRTTIPHPIILSPPI